MKLVNPYLLAIILGLAIPFIPEMEPFPIILGIIYFICGSLFGFVWPKPSWRWGIWITGPMTVLLLLSVLFAGQVDVFLKKDLPLLLLAITTTGLGSFLFARLKNKRTTEIKK
ncbi:hypothetical protein HKT18_04385 [Flavobacterium sp. IMCC34852]|uniref:Uncharacterized protein n=1 Tax=Flavobacterium rivulicola TaxID=2732161 RepID=A0A7Y3R7P5_9FLAO|nr:hypothetical protein [Flavobacterium sp. IMCC34852]NNT71450.1 hypothetical protein [Flavobacterium sp. IMCC34852]